jgi:prolyl-tRNA synthetase
MGCRFVDEAGAERPMVMGCYGMGETRVMAAAIEQHHDADGIVWPLPLAPFQVALLTLQRDEAVAAAAEGLHAALEARGVEVLFDDRDERPGAKFKDADLIGIPLRVAVGGRSLKEGVVEVKWRRDQAPTMVPVAEAADRIVALLAGERARLEAASPPAAGADQPSA